MKPTFETTKENNLIVKSVSEGLDNRLVPLAIEFEVVSNNSLFNQIIEESGISQRITKLIEAQSCKFEGYKKEFQDKEEEKYNRFRGLLLTAKPKITIKIELEKYE